MRGFTIRMFAAAIAAALPAGAWAESITVANNGGSVTAAFRDAYYRPWAGTGNTVVDTRSARTVRSALVETKNLIWDVVSVTAIHPATGRDEAARADRLA